MSKFIPSDWVEYKGKVFQVLGTRNTLAGEQFVYIFDKETRTGKKLKEFLKEGGAISQISGMEEIVVDKISANEVKKTSAPKSSQLKVGDLVTFPLVCSDSPLKIVAIKDNQVIVQGAAHRALNRVSADSFYHKEFNLPVTAHAGSFPLSDELFKKLAFQIGDEIEFTPSYYDYPILKDVFNTYKFKVTGVSLSGSINLSSETDRVSNKTIFPSSNYLAGEDDGKKQHIIYHWNVKNEFFKKIEKVLEKKKIVDSTISNSNEINLKNNAIDAAYRIGTRKIGKAGQQAIIAVLKKQGMKNKQLEAISTLLDTELGQAFISFALGMGLTHLPYLEDNDKVQRIAEEFRVEGMAVAGDVLFGEILSTFLNVVQPTISALPKLRVEDIEKSSVETVSEEEVDIEVDESEELHLKN